MEVRKIPWLSPERTELGRAGSVTVAPDRCISIATGSSVGLPLCLSPLCLSVCVCPLEQQVEASPKVGHEKNGTDRHDTVALGREKVFFTDF